ncbi:Protein-export membrane protein SecG [Candidatus Methylobacter favarea]|uniref:Protein-export membrane protein SecG n=1 Tax=Candidatus Methylobacter favarea TaxID=2707345 RepID=A0A8S0X1Z2_9GAMM|nr:preprotein translocase subunit SecG [Candidatus Methylobacter favarea]CAA9891522.1 Protein-export membrane protein SecG [Candidatus Methylobacter favarea]
MYQVIIVIHILLGLGVIGLVLMQQGKGADAGAAFGTGSSGSVFGAQGAASFLSRTTAILATLFFITSLGLAILNSHQGITYDLMSEPAVEQDTVGIPEVEGGKTADNFGEVPSAPAIPDAQLKADQDKTPVNETKIDKTVIPKPVKEKNNKNKESSGK